MNHSKRLSGALGMAVLAATLVTATACTSTTPNWDAVYGETVRTAVAQQVLNPNAGRDTDPVSGIDGVAAKAAVDEYRKSFTAPEPEKNTFTIGVSGAR